MEPLDPPLDVLSDRLRAFRFEESGASLTFAARLARDNGWAEDYALRVTEEYRRFLWLGRVASHTVSPSPAVDRAWHQHLLDTRSYWERLVPDVLGRPFHHEPSGGGPVDRSRLAEAYRRTLESYRGAFGPPPPDVWPAGEVAERARPRTIDLATHAVVPRLVTRGLGALLVLGALAAVVAVAGRAFLGVNAVAVVFASIELEVALLAVTAWLGHRALAAEPPPRGRPGALDVHELGYLQGGATGAVDVAVTELVCVGALSVRGGGLAVTRAAKAPSPLQRLVLDAVGARPRAPISQQRPASKAVAALLEPELVARGLVVPRRRRHWLLATPALGAALLVALDEVQLALAGQPLPPYVLVFAPLFLLLVGLALLGPLFRTKRGDAELDRRKRAFSPPRPSSPVDADLGLVVALFGAEALRGGTMVELAALLAPEPEPDGGGCGGCGG